LGARLKGKNSLPQYNLLMLSGDSSVARGIDGAFYQMLARFSNYWQRIDILTPTAPDARARTIHGNVYIHPAPNHRLLQARFIKQKGEELLSQRPYHLITSHDFGFFYNGIGAWWLLQNKNIPLVSEIHHIEGYPIATSLRERLWRLAAQQYIPFIAKRGAYFRVVNGDVAQQLQKFGVSPEKILLLYSLYLDLDIYQVQAVEKQYDNLFVGRLVSNKGIMLLLDAIAQVTQTHPKVTLAIRGEGALKTIIQRKITEMNIENNVIFLPRVADTNEMAKLYSSAKMLVCASTVEGNPRVTIEAMACGVPVISTSVGIMPEVINDGENGFLVDWNAEQIANTIIRLLDDSDLYEKIAQAGRQSVQKFEAEKIIRDYALGYHRIIEAHS
jgi:glycosyltransferase involved in cell wall biosynthesis